MKGNSPTDVPIIVMAVSQRVFLPRLKTIVRMERATPIKPRAAHLHPEVGGVAVIVGSVVDYRALDHAILLVKTAQHEGVPVLTIGPDGASAKTASALTALAGDGATTSVSGWPLTEETVAEWVRDCADRARDPQRTAVCASVS